MNKKVKCGLWAIALAGAAPAMAQDAGSGIDISGGINLVSDYRFRGISLSDEGPALQATLNLNHTNGFYAGIWGSSLDDTALYGEVELDFYVGWRQEVAPGTSLDAGLLYYWYPGGEDAAGDSDYFEPYAKLSHQLGPVSATLGVAYAWEQDAIGGNDNIYFSGDLAGSVPGTPLTLKGHVGYSDGSLAPGGNYVDWLIGADYALEPVVLGLSYADTDLPGARNVDAGLIASVSFSF